MANQEELINWAVANSKLLKLRVGLGSWTKDWLPSHVDVRASIEIEGVEHRGASLKTNFNEALTVAIAEAVERSICHLNNLPTNGVAVHKSRDMARANALNELIERDLLLCHFLTRTNLTLIPTEIAALGRESTMAKLEAEQVKVSFLKSHSFCDRTVVVCLAEGNQSERPFGSLFGFAACSDPHTAVSHSFEECLTNIVAWLNGEMNQANEINHTSYLHWEHPLAHRAFYLKQGSSMLLNELFNQSSPERTDSWNPDIRYEDIGIFHPYLAKCPLYCVKATSEDLQNMYYGATSKERVNFGRLDKFLGKKTCWDSIQSELPHMVG